MSAVLRWGQLTAQRRDSIWGGGNGGGIRGGCTIITNSLTTATSEGVAITIFKVLTVQKSKVLTVQKSKVLTVQKSKVLTVQKSKVLTVQKSKVSWLCTNRLLAVKLSRMMVGKLINPFL